MNCGSFDSFHVSWRCGCRPNARQILETAVCDRPTSAARDRVDQCVASFGVVSKVVVITRSTASSAIVRGRPGRGSSSRPSSRSTANRLRHLVTMLREIPRSSAICPFGAPGASAQANTTRDRNARA